MRAGGSTCVLPVPASVACPNGPSASLSDRERPKQELIQQLTC